MYDFHINEMADALVATGLISSEEKMEAQKALQTVWEHKIAIVWSTEDLKQYAEDLDMDLSQETLDNILDDLLHHHDCDHGITWDIVDTHMSKSEYMEESQVRSTAYEDLPLLMGHLETDHGKELLKRRLEEGTLCPTAHTAD